MKLDDIGFYTLTDDRANNISVHSNLQRCELLITSKCNFKCPYCRGTDKSADIRLIDAMNIVSQWSEHNLKNIRFSGGEPTIVPWLIDLIKYTKTYDCIERIALSTNGSAKTKLYDELINEGVNDFSISLDACCVEDGDLMSGGVKGSFDIVTKNIKHIAEQVYTTVGVVLTDYNISQTKDIIHYASNELNVSDIRIISSAQSNNAINQLNISNVILDKHPILSYRIRNISNGRHVRGLNSKDSTKCYMMLDDMAVKGNYHYPCIIKMREGCDPIGSMNDTIKKIRRDRLAYILSTNTHNDIICKNNCLDVCIDFNNKCKNKC